MHEPQIGDSVLDLAAFIERLRADDTIGNLGIAQALLERARLEVGAEQNRHVPIVATLLVRQLGDHPSDQPRFFGLVVGLENANRIALASG